MLSLPVGPFLAFEKRCRRPGAAAEWPSETAVGWLAAGRRQGAAERSLHAQAAVGAAGAPSLGGCAADGTRGAAPEQPAAAGDAGAGDPGGVVKDMGDKGDAGTSRRLLLWFLYIAFMLMFNVFILQLLVDATAFAVS